ncbi:MAG: 6-phosphogluconolactonase [Actinomycetota bacterium]|nr:6-phosphogluconolactonase [Actinomycetota bacterium]
MSERTLVVHRDADVLAAAVAARLVTSLVDAQACRGHASVVLTGGGVGTSVLRALAESPARDAVDWDAVDLWWGDERFLPAGDPERNETSAREALVDGLAVPPEQVHAMPASDGPDGDDLDAAAQRYAAELARAAASVGAAKASRGAAGPLLPAFDVCLLGVGPDSHVASLFPGHPALEATGTVVAVRRSPKPPPERLSLTFPALRAARQIWLLAAGSGKAEAVARTLSGASLNEVPASGAVATEATLVLVDRDAAAALPQAHR